MSCHKHNIYSAVIGIFDICITQKLKYKSVFRHCQWWSDSWCKKRTKQMMVIQFRLHMLYIYKTIIISVFRSALLRKSHIPLPSKSTEWKQIKNDNSCKVPISCKIYIVFTTKAQQPNEKLRPFMWLVTISEQEIKLNSVGFLTCMNHLRSDC